ncbi:MULTISPECIES: hypothetical protein [unclassified Microbacterium]|uniref:hypothetical protein n=1 Tax=unclassified Microbacterium TaxID=2609290 RepID=UPI0006F9051E|nr:MULTISPECIES: hypothetical protein [unclassified Microbacterium]KQR85838.1 hypothetical protein ASF96_13020 [Microbacterium sp. Leaf179]KQT72800.1 hypothetical protein ASG45_10490 [Microbacterium sp. Leaf436]MBD8477711.1 hypothetical protein [Microbacterium sp. CFBP 8794]
MTGLSPGGRSVIAGAVALSFLWGLTAPPAEAAWQSTAAAPAFSLSTGSLAAPVTQCKNVTSSPRAARIEWASVEGATGYDVTLGNTVNSSTTSLSQNQTNLFFEVRGSLLENLGLALGSLLTGGSVLVTVKARVGAWESAAGNAQPVVLSSLLGGLLTGGLKCQGT